ncbi:MAG: hypothetical protein RL309_1701 [Verrucomicrobiota bacterium]
MHSMGMPLIDTLIEKDFLPDSVIRWGIRRLLKQRLADERPDSAAARFAKVDAFAAELRTLPVAIETKADSITRSPRRSINSASAHA